MGLPENSARRVPLSRTSNPPGDEMTLTHTAFLSTAHHSKQSEFPSSLADPATTSPDQGDSVPEKRCVPLGYGPYLSTHICPCLSGKNTGLCRRVIHGPSSAGVRDEGSASRFSSLYLIASLPCHFAVLCTWFEGEALNILGFQRRECMGGYYHPTPLLHVNGM